MNKLNRGINFYPNLFLLQRIDINLVRFETELVPIKNVEDLHHLNYMRLRSRYVNAEVFSTVMSEANTAIFNSLLLNLYEEDDFIKETELYNLLFKNFELMRV